ncbi:MAG: hypothetical protein AAFP77_31250, partial [Bacteroidota bacterium]
PSSLLRSSPPPTMSSVFDLTGVLPTCIFPLSFMIGFLCSVNKPLDPDIYRQGLNTDHASFTPPNVR